MDWDTVRVFLAVARGGQFVAAAKRLKLDHATVSRRMAALTLQLSTGALALSLQDAINIPTLMSKLSSWSICYHAGRHHPQPLA